MTISETFHRNDSQSQRCCAIHCGFKGEDAKAMDPSLHCLSFHKLNKKLRVRIGSIQEELKLVVKIDKGLVRLPRQVRKYHRHKKSKCKKVGRKKEHSSNTSQTNCSQHPLKQHHHYNTYNLITKPVDSTLLVNLAAYANLPVKRAAKTKLPLQHIRKSNRTPILRVVRQEGQPSVGGEESTYKLFDERHTSHKSFKLRRKTGVEEGSVNIWQEGEGRFAFKDYVSVPCASKMESDIGNTKIDKSKFVCLEGKDQHEKRLGNESNSISNNNEVKVGDMFDIKSLPNGEKEVKLDSEECKLSTDLRHSHDDVQSPLENEDKQPFSQQMRLPSVGDQDETDSHFDQTVPSSPKTGHSHCNGSSPPGTGDVVAHEESQYTNQRGELVEKTDPNSDKEMTRDQQADEMPTLEPEELHTNKGGVFGGKNGFVKDENFTLENKYEKSLLSSDRSIGEKVDEEVKALLTNDVDTRDGDTPYSEGSTERSNIPHLDHVYKNSGAWENTPVVCQMEEAGKKQNAIELKPESDIHNGGDAYIKGGNRHDVAMHSEKRERHTDIKIKDENNEIVCKKIEQVWQEMDGESKKDEMLGSLKEEKNVLAQGSGFSEKLQRTDYKVEYDNNKWMKNNGETSQSATKFVKDEKATLAENGNASSTSNISENSTGNVPPESLSGDDSVNKYENKPHLPGNDPVTQSVNESQSDPASGSTDDCSQYPAESLEEGQVGRKGLKQLQSLTQHEAEVTSEQEDIISLTTGSLTGNEKGSPSNIPENCASEARSQSVIVSNPISLSSHVTIHGDMKGEQQESKLDISDPEVKRETEGNSLEDNETGIDSTCPIEESSASLERSELFQALTPPPPSYKPVAKSLKRQMSAPMINNISVSTPHQQDEETGIQITSVRTLAPLTNRGRPSPLSTAVENLKARHAASFQHVSMTKDMTIPVHTAVNEKRTMNHNVILQGPPVASLQATERGVIPLRSNREPQMHSPNLVDLTKGSSLKHVVTMGNDRERLMMTIPKHTDVKNLSAVQGYPTVVPNRNHVLSYPALSKEVEKPPVPLSEYNPEEQQQHFLEIKRHLLNSNAVGRTKDLASVPRVLPMAVSGPTARPVISVAPVTQKESRTIAVDEGKADSPLGKFSGAMMEHVRHWKEQNEKAKQPPPILSPVKLIPNPVPIDSSNQPVIYSPVVPSAHMPPTVPMGQANNITKDNKTVDAEAADANRGLLENLQAIHKMYFKTMQGGDKVVFPKMPPKQPMATPPGAMSDMVQVVKPFAPPAMQPHLIPRFPPNGQVPPELLQYQMNLMGRNFPAPSQMSPPGQDNIIPQGLIPRVPISNASERLQLKFHDMNARFPMPFPVVQLDQVKQNQIGKREMAMIRPTHPNQFPLPPQAYIGMKQQGVPHVKQDIVSPTSTQGMPIVVSPSGTKFIPGIDMTSHHKETMETTMKRKSDDAAPLDLSTGAAKVRRIKEENDDQSTEQPMDLSTKAKSSTEKLHNENGSALAQKVSGMDRAQPSNAGVFSYQGHLSPQSVATITKNGVPVRALPEHLLSQYNAQQIVSSSMQMTQSSIPPGVQLPMMHYTNAQMVLPHMTLPLNSRHSQQTQAEGNNHHLTQQLLSPKMLAQKRMSPPEQVEIMKLVSGNTGQLLPHGILPLNTHTTASPASSFPANVVSYSPTSGIPQSKTLVQQMPERNVEAPVKRKRGRPKGSGNKNRRAALIANQLLVQEPSESVPASSSSDIAECQFCDFKAASRGDVRQHVKVVHFAKFRRDSNKSLSSCEILTPTSEYAASGGHPMDSLNVESNTGQWTTVSEQNSVRKDHQSPTQAVQNESSISPITPSSDSDGSALVIDVSAEGHGAICPKQEEDVQEDATSIEESSQVISDCNQAVNLQSNEVPKANTGDRHDKPPLKITLRRISSSNGTTGDKTGMVFSSLPQDKGTTDKKAKFVCQKCGASYNYVNGLREHESRHRVDLPFECGVCHLKYKTLGMLSRHQAQKNHLTGQ